MTICYNISFSLHIFLSVCYLFLCLSGCLFVCLCTSGCVSIYLCIYISVLFFVIQLRPPTVIGQFHTLFFGSVRMFFLGVLGFAVYGNEALHFSCDPDSRELNLFCYNQFRPITPQVQKIWYTWFNSLFFSNSKSVVIFIFLQCLCCFSPL